MSWTTELMIASAFAGFLSGIVATAMFFAWAIYPRDSAQEQTE